MKTVSLSRNGIICFIKKVGGKRKEVIAYLNCSWNWCLLFSSGKTLKGGWTSTKDWKMLLSQLISKQDYTVSFKQLIVIILDKNQHFAPNWENALWSVDLVRKNVACLSNCESLKIKCCKSASSCDVLLTAHLRQFLLYNIAVVGVECSVFSCILFVFRAFQKIWVV